MRKWFAAAALASLVLGCGPGEDGSAVGEAVAEGSPEREDGAPAGNPPPGEAAADSASLPAELTGRDWRLTRFDRDEPAPEAVPITLRFDAGKISGGAGCNRYFATVTPGAAQGTITVGPVGATRMACPDEIMSAESRFLGALAQVVSFELEDEDLALGYRQEGVSRVLRFAPVDAGL